MKRMCHAIPMSGCIPAEELQFVMNHLPGKVGGQWGEYCEEYTGVMNARYPALRLTP